MAPLSPSHRPGCARLGIARLNAFRLNVYEPVPISFVDGIDVGALGSGKGLEIDGASVEQVLNDQPDTASFTAIGFVPVAGQRLTVSMGERTSEKAIFSGRIIERTVRYRERKEVVEYDLRCVDATWLLNRTTVLATYIGVSATTIAKELITRFARNVTTTNVQANLPLIDSISFLNEALPTCLSNICERIGAYWFLDYAGDLHLGTSEPTNANTINDANPRGSRNHTLTEDLSQVATRIIGRGGGVGAAVEVGPGATELPVEEGSDEPWYSPGGGLVEVRTQVLTYAGIRGRGGVGAFVGSGNAPSAAPDPTPNAGSSHTLYATYQYAASFVTASGETPAGPVGSITLLPLTMNPPTTPTARSRGAGKYPPGMLSPAGGPIRFAFQIGYQNAANGPMGAPSPSYTWDGNDWEIYIGAYSSAGGGWYPELEPSGFVAPVAWVRVYRSDNGGAWMPINYLPSSYSGSASGWWGGNCVGWTSGGGPFPVPPTGVGSVLVKSLPISNQASVTSRKLYRTVANGSALKLLATIANNSATDYADTIADAALGAAPPAADTSGIKDEGQVLAGSTTLPVSSTIPFSEDVGPSGGGGWVRVGAIPLRYAAIGSGVLSGIPATGVGSLTATVRYGTQVLAQPRLFGIPEAGGGSITMAIQRGDTVTIRLEMIDGTAANVMAARLQPPGQPFNQLDGIIDYVVGESRMGLVELSEQMEATMEQRKDPQLTLRFESRDLSLEVGRLITVNITTPPIAGTFRITRVGFSEIAAAGGRATVHPLRTIEATNKLFTIADFLRRLRLRKVVD
jgi:hypothetical protein